MAFSGKGHAIMKAVVLVKNAPENSKKEGEILFPQLLFHIIPNRVEWEIVHMCNGCGNYKKKGSYSNGICFGQKNATLGGQLVVPQIASSILLQRSF